jgi:adenosine deaminase
LYDAGVTISINSDDPIFFSTTLIDEYRLAARSFGFDAAELSDVVLRSVAATFLTEPEKTVMAARFTREITALRRELGL